MANQSKDEGLSSTVQQRPLQSQPRQPGRQNEMVPQPRSIPQGYQGSGKLAGKVAIITGGDSGIGRSVAVTAYRGSPELLDYSATKGAIVSFTRSLSQQLAKDGIRVNAVAPGPIWTPLIPATFDEVKVSKFGSNTPMGRAGEPHECGSCSVFLASDGESYMTGQVLHPNGGEIING